MPSLGKSLKFQFPEGTVHIDLTGDSAVVTNNDDEANTTIITTVKTLEGLRTGEINPMTAVFTGQVKIKGDAGLAMKLKSLLS